MGDLSTLTSEDIKQYICPEATSQECIIFLRFCLAQQLNPFAGDVFLVKYGGREPKASIQIGLPVYLRRASANPNYAGYAAGVIVKDNTGAYVDRDGAFLYPGDELFGAWARVHRKGAVEPLVHKVALSEYMKTYTRDGRTFKAGLWESKPATMIVVTATRQAIRRMFPETEQQIMDMYGPRFEGMMLEDLKDPEDVDLNPVLGEIAGREEPPPVPTEDDDYGLFGDAPATGGHSSVDTETGEIFDPPDNGGTPPVGDPPAFSEGAQPPSEDPDPMTSPEPPLTPEQMDQFLGKAEKAGLNQKMIEERIGGPIETHLVPWGRAQGCTSTTETILRLQ